MPFHTNPGTAGRKPGKVPENVKRTREILSKISENYLQEDINKDLQLMKPFDRAMVILKLMSYWMPSLKQVDETDTKINLFNVKITFDKQQNPEIENSTEDINYEEL